MSLGEREQPGERQLILWTELEQFEAKCKQASAATVMWVMLIGKRQKERVEPKSMIPNFAAAVHAPAVIRS